MVLHRHRQALRVWGIVEVWSCGELYARVAVSFRKIFALSVYARQVAEWPVLVDSAEGVFATLQNAVSGWPKRCRG